jgi:hypothetical protein
VQDPALLEWQIAAIKEGIAVVTGWAGQAVQLMNFAPRVAFGESSTWEPSLAQPTQLCGESGTGARAGG